MFISNQERNQIQKDIQSIGKMLNDMNTEILFLATKLKALQGRPAKPKKAHKPSKPSKTGGMTPEGRARVSAAVKAYHAKKKLEKQNANSISTPSV